MRRALSFLLSFTFLMGLWLAGAKQACAYQPRFALLIGASRGMPNEETLRFATTDARRMARALIDLGGFPPENVVVLEDPSADRTRDALARLNARLRAEAVRNEEHSMLVTYVSGHGDGEALHLGMTPLPWSELRNVVAGSSAMARILIIDACRSGQVTRVKGERDKGTVRLGPLGLPTAVGDLSGEGFAIMSSAAAGEAAQESDELEGSFFTHHLLAALAGAGDTNEDGTVTIAEAYRYASDRTVAATAKTFVGIQHPTYSWDLKGRAEIVLTHPVSASNMATLRLVAPGVYLLRTRGGAGPLFMEAMVGDAPRLISIVPGTYFLQHRTPERLHEARLQAAAGSRVDASRLSFAAVEYGRVVRKGGTVRTRASVLTGLLGITSAPLSGYGSGPWLGLEHSLETPIANWDIALGGSQSSEQALEVSSRLAALESTTGARKVFDFSHLSISFGLRVGMLAAWQRFGGERDVPARTTFSPLIQSNLRVELPMGSWGVCADLALRTTLWNQQTNDEGQRLRAVTTLISSLGVATYF